ncbi:Histone H1 [Orchesella cincta]|uniref:Histone H1 n=1 Tax=Orchesella cincta TaxID=48709 RepID=A0A1D2NKB3_ORCCI|nr:Histone H1 [Orchesella cincta]
MSDAENTETAAAPAAAPPAPAAAEPTKAKGKAKAPKKAAAPKESKPKAAKPKAKAADHPPTAEMVAAAIKGLGERQGSSLKAIKKYIADNYKVDVDKLAPFIRRYVKTAVTNGGLVQVKGKGANGSFRLPAGAKARPLEVPPQKSPKLPVLQRKLSLLPPRRPRLR